MCVENITVFPSLRPAGLISKLILTCGTIITEVDIKCKVASKAKINVFWNKKIILFTLSQDVRSEPTCRKNVNVWWF